MILESLSLQCCMDRVARKQVMRFMNDSFFPHENNDGSKGKFLIGDDLSNSAPLKSLELFGTNTVLANNPWVFNVMPLFRGCHHLS